MAVARLAMNPAIAFFSRSEMIDKSHRYEASREVLRERVPNRSVGDHRRQRPGRIVTMPRDDLGHDRARGGLDKIVIARAPDGRGAIAQFRARGDRVDGRGELFPGDPRVGRRQIVLGLQAHDDQSELLAREIATDDHAARRGRLAGRGDPELEQGIVEEQGPQRGLRRIGIRLVADRPRSDLLRQGVNDADRRRPHLRPVLAHLDLKARKLVDQRDPVGELLLELPDAVRPDARPVNDHDRAHVGPSLDHPTDQADATRGAQGEVTDRPLVDTMVRP